MLLKNNRGKSLAAGVMAGVLVLTACGDGNGGDGGGGGDAEGLTEIVVATPAEPTVLDWGHSFQAGLANYQARANLNAGLVRHPYVDNPLEPSYDDMDFTEVEGILADPDEPFTWSDDETVLTFHLREDVVSQAGNPLTAEDVRYSMERKCETYALGCWTTVSAYLLDHESIEVVDDHTVEFHLEDPDEGLPLLEWLGGFEAYIVDKEVLEEHATDDDPYATEWANENSGWGFGPYTIESWTPNQQLVFEANENYVLGEPEIERVIWEIVEDSGTRAQLLQAGDVDIADNLTPEDQLAIAEAEGVIVPEIEAPIELAALAMPQINEPFDDPLVRRAFRYAIPYEEILDEIYHGRATTSAGWFTETMGIAGYSDEPAYTTDLDQARDLLDEAGVDEVDFTMHVSTATPDLVNTAILMSSYIDEVGFNMEVQQMNAGDFATGRGEQEFQALMATNRVQVQHPMHVIRSFYNPDDPANNNGAYEPTEEMNQMVEDAVAAGHHSEEESGELWMEMQDYFIEDASNLPILYQQPLQAYSDQLTGLQYRFDNTIDYSTITAANAE